MDLFVALQLNRMMTRSALLDLNTDDQYSEYEEDEDAEYSDSPELYMGKGRCPWLNAYFIISFIIVMIVIICKHRDLILSYK